MEGLRIAPQGQGAYKGLNETINESEEVWPVNTNKVFRTTPQGNNDPSEGRRNLSVFNRPKNKMDGGRRGSKSKSRKAKSRKSKSRKMRRLRN